MHLHIVEIAQRGEPGRASREIDTLRESVLAHVAPARPSVHTVAVDSSEAPEDAIGFLALQGRRIADAVTAGARAGHHVLVYGGNCTCLPGVLGGLQRAFGPATRIGLVWFDAHGDFNTPQTTLSGMLGGMPVAVSAGLALPEWREGALQDVPLPTDRIVMVDVRNLDPNEDRLIRWTGVTVVPIDEHEVGEAARRLAQRVDLIYLHIDADVLDASLVPTHRTREPDGPDVAQVLRAVAAVTETGSVRAAGLVSVYAEGDGADTTLQSATGLLRGMLASWLA